MHSSGMFRIRQSRLSGWSPETFKRAFLICACAQAPGRASQLTGGEQSCPADSSRAWTEFCGAISLQTLSSSPFAIAAFLLVVLLACHEVGYRFGLRVKGFDDDYKRRVDMIRTAILALVTFLIGFSFAGAGTRYIDRQDMIVKEANAIGTAYLRAMLLPESQRGRLQAELRQYTMDRLELLNSYGPALTRPLLAKAGESQKRFWQAGVDGVGTDREFANFMLPPLNDVIDIHSEHLSAARRHIPQTILIVIVITAAIGMGMIGYDNGLVRKRYFFLSGAFALVSAAALWMTIDLDRPRHGFMRTSELPYVELLDSMK